MTERTALSFTDRTLLTMGNLTLWPCLYTLGVAIYWSTLTRSALTAGTMLFIALLAHATYTLDRVKTSNTRWDPADFASDPPRHTFIRSYARTLRRVVAVELALCALIAATSDPVLLIPLVGSVVVTALYAGSPPGPSTKRLKDVLGLKSPLIASGILALCVVATRGDDPIGAHTASIDPTIALGMFFIVFGDTVLCDLSDRVSDRDHGTPSIPVTLGPGAASVIGVAAVTIGSALLVTLAQSRLALEARTSISAMLIASAVLSLRTHRVRDWIDARMLPVVLFGLWLAA